MGIDISKAIRMPLVLAAILAATFCLAGCFGGGSGNEEPEANTAARYEGTRHGNGDDPSTETTTTSIDGGGSQEPSHFSDTGENGNIETTVTEIPSDQVEPVEVDSEEDAEQFIGVLSNMIGSGSADAFMACCAESVDAIPSQYRNKDNIVYGLLTDETYRNYFFGTATSKDTRIESAEKTAEDGDGTAYVVIYTTTYSMNDTDVTEQYSATIKANEDGKVVNFQLRPIR